MVCLAPPEGYLASGPLHQHVLIGGMAGQFGNGGGFVVDPYQGQFGFEQMLEHPDAVHDLVGILLHQPIVGADVGLNSSPLTIRISVS